MKFILILGWKVLAKTCSIVCFVSKRLTDVKRILKKTQTHWWKESMKWIHNKE